jgi:hypothetical protein
MDSSPILKISDRYKHSLSLVLTSFEELLKCVRIFFIITQYDPDDVNLAFA